MNQHRLSCNHSTSRGLFARCLVMLMLALGAGAAMAHMDPPGRVATVSHFEGSVVFAPSGETEWVDAARNRPITRGDRLWTDEGARAEVHLGSAALHLNGRTFLEMIALDAEVLQANLNEGTVNARIRRLQGGDNFEINTPQLAFRAAEPGDYRIDVDPTRGTTRVVIYAGAGAVYGAGGGAFQLQVGQQMVFTGRDLAQVQAASFATRDGFDRWAAERNRAEDQSIAARYVPREVVGYQQLDSNGTWADDATYGAVWFPRVTVADWAPYRYGRWEWITPWGWTWVDDAPWGFAPFHYGRWTEIGSRWAWVPGRLGPRPVYAPALVVFIGGSNGSLSISSGPGIGWYPLAPGEVWQPFFRASAVYVSSVNQYIGANRYDSGSYYFQRRPEAITTVRVEDFSRGRPVHSQWRPVTQVELARAQLVTPLAMPEQRRWARETYRSAQLQVQPPVRQLVPPVMASRLPSVPQAPAVEQRREAARVQPNFRGRDEAGLQHQQQQVQPQVRPITAPAVASHPQPVYQPPAVEQRREVPRMQPRAHDEAASQHQLHQPQQHRAQRDQQVLQQQQQAAQHMQVQRQREVAEHQHQQQAQAQRDHAARQQQAATAAAQEVQRQQASQHQQRAAAAQQQAARQQAAQQQLQREQAVQQQQQHQMQLQQQQQHQQQRSAAMQRQQQLPPQQAAPQQAAPQQVAPQQRGEERGRGRPHLREERAGGPGQQGGEDESGRGQGRSHRFN